MSRSRRSAKSPPPVSSFWQPLERVYQAALAYRAAGLSFIPIQVDGSKQPCRELLPFVRRSTGSRRFRSWSPFMKRLPTVDEIDRWFHPRHHNYAGLAIVCGAVSGGLEVVDFDNLALFERWQRSLDEQEKIWFHKLVWVRSPRPGMHGYFRSDHCGGNQKLAACLEAGQNDPPRLTTLVEIKGEGGLVLAPPSPGDCHPSGREYRFHDARNLTAITMLTTSERERLFASIRAFDERPKTQSRHAVHRLNLPQSVDAGSGRPGDDFNARGDWSTLLSEYGWTLVGEVAGGCEYWRRPGKASGVSASVNYGNSDRLYVFSANAAPFDGGRSYSKFEAYAWLAHAGDFSAAATALRRLGYGFGRIDGLVLPTFADAYRDIGPLDF